MTAYAALLRAVNVGGTAKLPSAELKAMGEACGFEQVRTFIASGNLLFASALDEAAVRKAIEAKVEARFGRHVPVLVRTAKEMAELVEENPFPDHPGNRNVVLFVDDEPAQSMIDAARHVDKERLALGPRALYIAYDEGMGTSKLTLPAQKTGTARNMNSVAKMAALLAEIE